MLGITRYILRQLVVGMVLVSIGLAFVLWLTQSLRFVELIVNKGLSIAGFLHLTVLLLPSFLIVILPVSLFAVVLFTYNRLASDRELVVLRAAGVSQWGLSRPAVLLAVFATLLGYALNMHYIPQSVRDFRQLQWTVRHDVSGILLQEGSFNQVRTGLTVFVRERAADGSLHGIIVHDDTDPSKAVTMMAEKGALVSGPNGPRVLMENGNRQEVSDSRLSTLYFDAYAVEFGASADGTRYRDPREMPLAELFGTPEADIGPSEYRRYHVEGHQRLLAPLYHLTLTLVALATLLTGEFSRRGQSWRVLAAVGFMVAIEAGALGAANLAAKQPSLIPLIYVNALLPGLIGAQVLLSSQRRVGSRSAVPTAGAV